MMKLGACLLAAVLCPAALGVGSVMAGSFSGGGASFYLGTGSPNSVDAAKELARDLSVQDETGNVGLGVLGFYQGNRFRLGGAVQSQIWGSGNFRDHHGNDDVAGVAALIGGLYATYTMRSDRVLLNAGGTVGAGRCLLGFSLGNAGVDEEAHVATFYVEPHVSVGVAACRWFGVEFQLSSPLYLLTEDLQLDYGGKSYVVQGSDLAGVQFGVNLTTGLIADPRGR